MFLELSGLNQEIVSEWKASNKQRQCFAECPIGIQNGIKRLTQFTEKQMASVEKAWGVVFARPQAEA